MNWKFILIVGIFEVIPLINENGYASQAKSEKVQLIHHALVARNAVKQKLKAEQDVLSSVQDVVSLNNYYFTQMAEETNKTIDLYLKVAMEKYRVTSSRVDQSDSFLFEDLVASEFINRFKDLLGRFPIIHPYFMCQTMQNFDARVYCQARTVLQQEAAKNRLLASSHMQFNS